MPLNGISVLRIKDKDVAKFLAEDISEGSLIYDQKNSPNTAFINMTPNGAKNNGKDWKFVVKYDVERPADGNDVQIGAGKFVHYFSPFSDDLFGETRKIVAGQQVILFHEQSSC